MKRVVNFISAKNHRCLAQIASHLWFFHLFIYIESQNEKHLLIVMWRVAMSYEVRVI